MRLVLTFINLLLLCMAANAADNQSTFNLAQSSSPQLMKQVQPAPQPAAVPANLTTTQAKASYGLGVETAKALIYEQMDINLDLYLQGFKDGFTGAPLLVPMQDLDAAIKTYQQTLVSQHAVLLAAMSQKSLQEGQAFLNKNINQPGVYTLPGGLQYKVIETGTGPRPTDNDTVTVEYTGYSVDGKVFGSTAQDGSPMTFVLKEMNIPGWIEALKMMNEGSTWMIYLPPELGFGSSGRPPIVWPNQVLIFKLHLVKVKQ